MVIQNKDIESEIYQYSMLIEYYDVIQGLLIILIILITIALVAVMKLESKISLIICIFIFNIFTAIYILFKYRKSVFSSEGFNKLINKNSVNTKSIQKIKKKNNE